jgi:chromosome segregation ATPase
MARSGRRALRLNLKEFDRYLEEHRDEHRACYRQVQQVEEQIQERFDQVLEAWQETFGYCYPQLMSRRSEMPADFQALIDRIEGEERARIKGEIEDLDREVQEGQAQMDRYLQEAQAATQSLRRTNPAINNREERLKAQMVEFQDEYAQAYEELEELDTSLTGWFKNFGRIRRLKKVQRMAKRQQEETLTRLRNVRQEWLERVEKTSDTQSELRQQWQALGVRVAEAKGRRNRLQANFDTLAEEAAIRRTLEELDQAPALDDELGERLREMVRRNRIRAAYETALRQTSELRGRLGGLGDGLERFHKSIRSVRREQQRYNLARVEVNLPPLVGQMNSVWQELYQKIRDEQEMVANPRELAEIATYYNENRLTDDQIKTFFEEMGEALNRATSRWD